MTAWKQQHTWFVIAGIVVVLLVMILVATRFRGKVAAGAQTLLNADTMHVQVELLLNLPATLKGAERPFTKVVTRLDGDMNRAQDKTPQFGGTLFLEARGRGNIFFADGNLRTLRDEVFFHLDNLPVFLNPSGSLVKRWTRVPAPVMQVKNVDQVKEVLGEVVAKAVPAGKESVQGERLARFTIALSEEEETALADVLRKETSGSSALHTLARLLDANQVEEFSVWTKGKELRQIRVHFVRPLRDGKTFDFALLTLRFTDYGKEVAIERPDSKLFVAPDVFARMFGVGSVEEVKPQRE